MEKLEVSIYRCANRPNGSNAIAQLKNRGDRRIIVTAWNPAGAGYDGFASVPYVFPFFSA